MTVEVTSLETFVASPWENRNLHEAYRNSAFNFSNAPEYAPSEVLLGSLYRRVGLRESSPTSRGSGKALPESEVGKNGTALLRLIDKRRKKGQEGALLSTDGWDSIVNEVIRSPRQTNQRSKKIVQMTPVVPSTAIYSMAARLRGNPWNPGSLIESCLCLGAGSEDTAEHVWHKLFRALDVTQQGDDVWARFLEREFKAWSDGKYCWEYGGLSSFEGWMSIWEQTGITFPAQRFTLDLSHVIKAKPFLMRRQWVSLLESILRVGLGAHVLWVSKINYELFGMVESVLNRQGIPSQDDIRDRLSTGEGFWSYGQLANPQVKKSIRNYMLGRVGLNMFLHRCQQVGGLKDLFADRACPLESLESIHKLLVSLNEHLDDFNPAEFRANLNSALEADPRKLAIKQGVGKNVEEFLRHSLGQRETNERGLESYDQGYLLSRRGSYSRAPWVLSAGPVMILALVCCCTNDGTGTRTVEDLCNHLAAYGIKISPDDVADSSLGASLRTLGLVLDSPDAEGGMVLLDPFQLNIGEDES